MKSIRGAVWAILCISVVPFLIYLLGFHPIWESNLGSYKLSHLFRISGCKECHLPVVHGRERIAESLAKLEGLRWLKWKEVLISNLNSAEKRIPKFIWVVANSSESLSPGVLSAFQKNPTWRPFLVDDAHASEFMHTVFAGTSLLWAFNRINPRLVASRVDIFRYAVLYAFGGVNLHSNSSFDYPLDQLLVNNASSVLLKDASTVYNTDCYNQEFVLGNEEFAANNSTFVKSLPFTSHALRQSVLLSAPGHPFLLDSLTNIVEIIKKTYLKSSVSNGPMNETGKVSCSTGQDLYTASVRHVIYEYQQAGNESNLNYMYIDDQLLKELNKPKLYNLPALPSNETITNAIKKLRDWTWQEVTSNFVLDETQISRYIWVTMKQYGKKEKEKMQFLSAAFKMNPTWKPVIVDDDNVVKFMNTVFAGTSLLWAFNRINPRLGAARADVFRYAVLYVFGGVYVDLDSSFLYQLDEFRTEKIRFIVSREGNEYSDCYKRSFYLGDETIAVKSSSFVKSLPFGSSKLVQWLMISAPRHPFMHEILTNVVEIVKSAYLGNPVYLEPMEPGKRLVCTTGPDLYTASVRHVIYQYQKAGRSGQLHYLFNGQDYAWMGGRFKTAVNDENTHWSSLVRRGLPLFIDK